MPASKRLIDVVASLFGLVILSPVILLVALAVKLSSRGPAIFRQTRLGRNEKPFTLYKFRTMYEGTAHRATHEISPASVTPVGRVLRRFKLDELPQLWNVLVGEMSLVGPRPCLPSQTRLVSARRKRNVFSIPPGMTGLAQVEGVDMSKPEKLAEMDEAYVKSQSLARDIGLILRTIFRG